MAAPPARPKPIAFVCVVRFAMPQARNAFYATSGQAGQGAEVQARKMLAALGICDVELVTWVQPRAKAAKAANAAAGAGAGRRRRPQGDLRLHRGHDAHPVPRRVRTVLQLRSADAGEVRETECAAAEGGHVVPGVAARGAANNVTGHGGCLDVGRCKGRVAGFVPVLHPWWSWLL